MEYRLDGSWEIFEQCLAAPSVSEFRRRARPMDKRSNRQLIDGLVQSNINGEDGVFPDKNTFIEQK